MDNLGDEIVPNIRFYFTPVKISRVIGQFLDSKIPALSLNYWRGENSRFGCSTSKNPDTKRVDVSSAILDTFHDFPTSVAYRPSTLSTLLSMNSSLLLPLLLVPPF